MGFSLVGYRDSNASQNGDGTTLQRRAILNADNDGETTISALAYLANTVGIVRGSSHPSYPLAQVINISPSREDGSHRVFYMDIEYATNALRRTNNPSAEEGNPLLEPSRRTFSTTTISRTLTHSPLTGVPLRNGFGDIIPTDWPFTVFVLTITRNEAIDTVAHYANYHETIDNAGGANTGLLGAYPGEILLRISRGEEKYRSNLWYMEVDYELHAMPRVLIPSVFNVEDDECPLYNLNGSIKSYTPIDWTDPDSYYPASPTSAYVSAFDRLELQQSEEYWAVDSAGPPVTWKRMKFRNEDGTETGKPGLIQINGLRLLDQNKRLGDSGQPTHPIYQAVMGFRRTNFADLNLLAV